MGAISTAAGPDTLTSAQLELETVPDATKENLN